MILLVDQVTKQGELLRLSLKTAGLSVDAISILYDGYLPKGVTSPYAYYIEQDAEEENASRKPLFFNQLKVPYLWEIKGTNGDAEILYYTQVKARIYYAEPRHKRYIRIVDWLDDKGAVRTSDHYDCHGRRFAQTVLADGRPVWKSYFNHAGEEILLENLTSGVITLRNKGQEHVFLSKTEFVLYYLLDAGLDLEKVLFNSLSTSYFVSAGLANMKVAGEDILFWQEPIRDTIPGNMVTLFNNPRRVRRVVVQSREAYEKLCIKILDEEKYGKGIANQKEAQEMVCALGFVYPYVRENEGRKSALMLTNSDQIEHLEELVQGSVDVQWHIAALTEMSAKLMGMEQYTNVHLYPNVSIKALEKLFTDCDVYLDLNHGSEVLDAVYRAYLNNMLILGYRQTAHNKGYAAPWNLLDGTAPDAVSSLLVRIHHFFERKDYEELLREQRNHAMEEKIETYKHLLAEM